MISAKIPTTLRPPHSYTSGSDERDIKRNDVPFLQQSRTVRAPHLQAMRGAPLRAACSKTERAEHVESNDNPRKSLTGTKLSNASAVLEARNAIKQGENIGVLTIMSTLSLPVGFVPCIFGM